MNDWDSLSEQSVREILPWKLHGLTHNDTINSHLLSTATAKKTPYQLDLEIKDRKPDIVPKVGDKVKIKSREWYEKWKNEEGNINGMERQIFVSEMSKYCGKVFKVKNEIFSVFTLEDARFGWIMSMFEEVYPQESSKEEKCTKGLYSSSISASALANQLTAASAITAINPIQGSGTPIDWSKLVSSIATRIISPQQSSFCNAGFYCQSVLKDEEPELQTIKKHRFIKLEKL